MTSPKADAGQTDVITELEFELIDSEIPFIELSKELSCEMRLLESIQLASGTSIEYFGLDIADTGRIRPSCRRTGSLECNRVIERDQGHPIVSLTTNCPSISQSIEGSGGVPKTVIANEGVGTVTAQVPVAGNPTAVIKSVVEDHPSAELFARRQYPMPVPVFTQKDIKTLVREHLTPRQWEVLETAIDAGYFERPRRHTGQEIATMLDISSATFSQHLRSAQSNLLTLIFNR